MTGVPRFRVQCWGARGTIPAPGPQTVRYGGNTSCIEIETSFGSRIVLDAGSGIRSLGAHLTQNRDAAPIQSTTHLFLTHRHLDHVMGLPFFQPLRNPNETIIVRCGNSTAEQFTDLAAALLGPPLFVPIPTLREVLRVLPCLTRAAMEVDRSCQVQKFEARHNGGAGIFRIDDGAGAALAYAPDNELSYASDDSAVRQWRVGLTEALRGVSVLIHDATFRNDELERYAGWGHSSAEEATRFAIECDATSLLLFHHHPDRSDHEIDAIVATCCEIARQHGSPLTISAAYEGLSFSI